MAWRSPSTVAVSRNLSALQVLLVGRHVRGALAGRNVLFRQQPQLQRIDHGAGHVFLQLEDILQLAVIGFGPDHRAGAGLHELHGHAQPVARLAHAAIEDVGHVQRARDGGDVVATLAECEGRGAGRHPQFRNPGEQREQLLGQAVRQEGLVASFAQVRERQHGDGGCIGGYGLAHSACGGGGQSPARWRLPGSRAGAAASSRLRQRPRTPAAAATASRRPRPARGRADAGGAWPRAVCAANCPVDAKRSVGSGAARVASVFPQRALERGFARWPRQLAQRRAVPGKQFVQHHAQGIDVAAYVDRFAAQQFRAGVFRCQGAAEAARQRGRRVSACSSRATPKSSSRASPWSVTRMLEGFRSR